jgi:hypothetical protein
MKREKFVHGYFQVLLLCIFGSTHGRRATYAIHSSNMAMAIRGSPTYGLHIGTYEWVVVGE